MSSNLGRPPALQPVFASESDQSFAVIRAQLADLQISLPAQSDPEFPLPLRERRMLVAGRDGTGQLVWGALATVTASRVVPWRTIVRLPRFGRQIPREAMRSACEALVQLGQRTSALRVHCEIMDPDPVSRNQLMEELQGAGFRPQQKPRLYEKTVLIDLRASEEDLLASFHSTCRRHIRALDKHALDCHRVEDESFAPRLEALTRETMARTGGRFEATNWPSVISYTRREPSKATLLGVFRSGAEDHSALVGYVLGYRHGKLVEYANAASARLSDLRAPLLYAPTWALMRWGKQHGAEWFDFGGVTTEEPESSQATSGIADFKFYFSRKTTQVGCELVYAPSGRLELAARVASAAIGSISRKMKR